MTANLTNQKILNIVIVIIQQTKNKSKYIREILFSYLFRLSDNIRWVKNQNINFSKNMRYKALNLGRKIVTI